MANETVVPALSVRVRGALPADAAGILALLAGVREDSPLAALDPLPADPAPLAKALELMGQQGTVVLAEDALSAELLGVAFTVRGPGPASHTAIISLAVDAAARRRGAGRALLRASADWARSAGVERLVASVASGNGGALALFGAAGYAIEGRRPGHLRIGGHAYDEVLFGLAVDNGRDGDRRGGRR